MNGAGADDPVKTFRALLRTFRKAAIDFCYCYKENTELRDRFQKVIDEIDAVHRKILYAESLYDKLCLIYDSHLNCARIDFKQLPASTEVSSPFRHVLEEAGESIRGFQLPADFDPDERKKLVLYAEIDRLTLELQDRDRDYERLQSAVEKQNRIRHFAVSQMEDGAVWETAWKRIGLVIRAKNEDDYRRRADLG
jgi:hypothetical protein